MIRFSDGEETGGRRAAFAAAVSVRANHSIDQQRVSYRTHSTIVDGALEVFWGWILKKSMEVFSKIGYVFLKKGYVFFEKGYVFLSAFHNLSRQQSQKARKGRGSSRVGKQLYTKYTSSMAVRITYTWYTIIWSTEMILKSSSVNC